MKKLPLLLCWSLMLFACEPAPEVCPKSGTAAALRNGTLWIPTCVLSWAIKTDSTYDYNFVSSLDKYRTQTLSFSEYPLKVGVYTISDKSGKGAFYYTIIGGDAFEDHLIPWEQDSAHSPTNYFEITSINGNQVRGRFQVTFVETDAFPISNPKLEDTIRFTEGAFMVTIPPR